jgi:hypothetical protein
MGNLNSPKNEMDSINHSLKSEIPSFFLDSEFGGRFF